MKPDISVVILTYNEELHIARCIKSLFHIAKNIYVVDSFSTDNTVKIAETLGAKVYQNPWSNYAQQFQWGLDNCPIDTEWVMRMDADEYLENDLIDEINSKTSSLSGSINGVYLKRKQKFLGRWIKYGDRYPLILLRIWRHGQGRIEQRWMDEHIIVDNPQTIQFEGNLVDDNLNNTRWWVEKHNKYADREMLDVLNDQYHFFSKDDSIKVTTDPQAKSKRKIKEHIYNRIPIFVRPTLYFIYRYVFRLGFLDGVQGFAYHFMQGFWYRCLVDLRVYEARQKINSETDPERIREILFELTGLNI